MNSSVVKGITTTDINFAIDVLSHPQSGDESDINMALDIAIRLLKAWREALEQEPVLNKIRAEMFEEMLSHSGTGEIVIQAYADGLKKGLKIIDEHKAESEE